MVSLVDFNNYFFHAKIKGYVMLPEWVDWGFVEATWRIGVIMGVLIGFLLGMVVRYLMHSLQDHHRKGYTVNDVL